MGQGESKYDLNKLPEAKKAYNISRSAKSQKEYKVHMNEADARCFERLLKTINTGEFYTVCSPDLSSDFRKRLQENGYDIKEKHYIDDTVPPSLEISWEGQK